MGYVKNGPVLVVTGTLREASLVSGEGIEVLAGGSDPARLQAELEAMAPYVAGIISFGMCGAIDHTLKLGDFVIGKRVSGAFHGKCDERWVNALKQALPLAWCGSVFADGHMLALQRDKAEQAWMSSALAADMESHLAARVAAEHDVPFVVLRCVSDRAEVDLPPAVSVMMAPDGGVNVGAVARSVWEQPGQLRELAGTLAGFAKAFQMLSSGTKKLRGRLAFDQR
jgi:adenosylhomocysteine nucleosidase